MKRLTSALGFCSLCLVAAPTAEAGCTPVIGAIASGCAQIFEVDQVTKFEIDNLPTETSGDAGLLTVRAQGDYAPGNNLEGLIVDVDDVCEVDGWALAPGTAIVSQTAGTDWVGSWFISSDLLEEILADGVVEVTITNKEDVNVRGDTDFFSFAISRPARQTAAEDLPLPCLPPE